VVHKATLNVAHKGYVMIYVYTISFNQIQYTLSYPTDEEKKWMIQVLDVIANYRNSEMCTWHLVCSIILNTVKLVAKVY
jgi:hypothetical protein